MTTIQNNAAASVTVNDVVLSVPRLADDDRARRSCDVFGTATPGDINLTWAYPGRIVAWHRHARQTDHWYVIKGHLKVGLMDDDRNVRFHQTVDLARRLAAQGVPFEELVLPNEIHGFLRHASWLEADSATVAFFDKTLGERREAASRSR